MRAVIQRVSQASVSIDEKKVASINEGILVLLGIETQDTKEDSEWLSNKISSLRIFSDKDGKMNKSVTEVNGEVIVVSQFTLHAKTKKGNRPSYIKSSRPEHAMPLYEQFKKDLSDVIGKEVQSGEFAADMKVSLTNDGPVTIIIDTKNKE
ncbi:MAG: D-tyrosyl-tRNA(Tyr) deacylase [Flavobacteriales bacterium]|jgi:D-aminoacyl-tRNA deacylase|nr:D-tyrosyl-tRNA(Tyr) deacylase [Flavobacteriales bacterium]MBT5354726.1 D-tyrosyl-tRNA(Tyr) deacylase [Flavobacteriales bacterium]MBT5699645.1 D-tyrosyl-tRNA(Tyr) deacylase [Flavobacteriales bacterium]MBT7620065.1 D-tyrosyl-tRNA(Tyr) deacylase [Flavobacteriales bacterium]MDG2059984.1 D-aminoacyl-tRNA deacylase [Flavobacteriales bacterium]